jgi:hypothetical protein
MACCSLCMGTEHSRGQHSAATEKSTHPVGGATAFSTNTWRSCIAKTAGTPDCGCSSDNGSTAAAGGTAPPCHILIGNL